MHLSQLHCGGDTNGEGDAIVHENNCLPQILGAFCAHCTEKVEIVHLWCAKNLLPPRANKKFPIIYILALTNVGTSIVR